MLKIFAQLLDRWVIWGASRHHRVRPSNDPRANEAAALLQDPDYFCNNAGPPRNFTLHETGDFEFISHIETPWPENNRACGKFFPASPDWAAHPLVLLIHGWNDEQGYRLRSPFIAAGLNRNKINVAALQLCYHLDRRPQAGGVAADFISDDLFQMVEASRQAIADVRGLMRWFQSKSRQPVALWGISLGAWIGGLVVCHDATLAAAVLTTPIADLEQAISELAFCAPVRRALAQTQLDLFKLDLATHAPSIDPSRILFVEAQYDLFARAERVEALWQKWREPQIRRYRHGHISLLLSTKITRQTAYWLVEQLVPR